MHFLTTLGSIALVVMTAHGQEKIPERTIEAPISSVTVFPSGARITLASQIELEKGRTRLRVDLLEDTNEKQLGMIVGMQANATGAHILETGLDLHRRKGTPEELATLDRTIESTREALQAARIRASNSRSDVDLLDRVASRMAEGAADLDRTQLVDLLSFLSERRRGLSEDILRQTTASTEQQKRIDKLVIDRKRLEEGIPVGVLELLVDSEGGEASISITWHDEESYWEPAYHIEREEQSGATSVTLDARVSNGSMIDWTNTRIELSSADPDPIVLLEPVTPVSIDIASKDEAQADAEVYYGRVGTPMAADLPGSAITQAGTVAVYSLDEPATIDSMSRRRLQFGRFDTTASMKALARPTVDPEVYSQAVLQNAPELLLLPGHVSLFVNGTYVGETAIEVDVPPGTTFEIAYGPMPKVTVDRVVVERDTVSTGLLGGGRRTRTSYRIEIHNGRTTPIDLILEDRMPVSRTSDIEVSLKNLSLPLSTDTDYLATEQPQGILRWDIQLPAGGPDAAPLVVEWTVDVSRSSDIDTTPVPE